MKPEEFEVYIIPPNFMEGGTLFGGLLKTRNTIEAVILGLAVGVPVLRLPFSLTVRVVILCLTALPLVLLCSATSFLRNWDSILEKKRANLRSISEPARLRQPPPQKHGSGTRKRAGSKHTGGATNSRPSRAFCPLVG